MALAFSMRVVGYVFSEIYKWTRECSVVERDTVEKDFIEITVREWLYFAGVGRRRILLCF